MDGALRLVCADLDAPPLFRSSDGSQHRVGFEPDVGRAVAAALGRPLVWLFRPWVEMVPTVLAGEGDGVLCGQGITSERLEVVDFTRPYAVFNESLLVRSGEGIDSPADLAGRRIGAIAGSTNMALAETFSGAVRVPFSGASNDVFGEMVAALRGGDVDGVVDDDVALVPLANEPGLAIAFTVETANRWGIAVAKTRSELRAELDLALDRIDRDGTLRATWRRWMPTLPYPF